MLPLVLSATLLAGESKLSVAPAEVQLATSRAQQQLIVTHSAADGFVYDRTRDVTFESADETIAVVDPAGIVFPRRQGTTVIRVRDSKATPEGLRVDVPVIVSDLEKTVPVSFRTK